MQVIATDLDSGTNGKIKYFITNGNTAGTFQLNEDSGTVHKQSFVYCRFV